MYNLIQRIKTTLNALDRIPYIERALYENMSPVDRFCALSTTQHFTGHYEIWRTKRIHKILEYYGTDWTGRKVVELATGFGDIGAFFASLGAEVVCIEGRIHNINIAKIRFANLKNITFMHYNLEDDFSGLGRFDLAIHFGLLYHIRNYEQNLACTATLSDNIVLETEVVDSFDPHKVVMFEENKEHRDRSIIGWGFRCSPFFIKEFFENKGFDVDIVNDRWLDTPTHNYSWEHKNDGSHQANRRRFFRIVKRAPFTGTTTSGHQSDEPSTNRRGFP